MGNESLLHLLADLVSIRSENPPGLEAGVIDYLEQYFVDANIMPTRIESGLLGRQSLIAILKGKSSKDGIIFTGHSDVVTVSAKERERWLTDPFEAVVKDGKLYGRGSTDMKSGLAASIFAFCELARNNITPERDIAIVVTVDEEDSMMGSRSLANHPLLENFKYVVVCEPTSLELCTKSRGRTYGVIHCQGQTAHGSRPEAGNNAILIAHEFITHLMSEDFSAYQNEYGKSHLRPLGIFAGVDPWVVPDTCDIKVDARLTLGHPTEDIWQRIETICQKMKKANPSINVNYEIIDRRESWACSDGFIKDSFKKLLAEHNLDSEEFCFTGTTDGTHLRSTFREAVIIGPGDLACAHQENECVSIDELNKAYEIYKELMLLK